MSVFLTPPPPEQVYQLLLGITALSLLATPLVIIASSRLLKGSGGVGGGAGGVSRMPLMQMELN